ncbi:MAG: hypothetical protein DHS20C19_18030 [Acidimicrobiales bacterium]|nr:MAG: hypothetical protein DHS20C19_18030 [Acidimicrobiales bacterium]
MLPVARRLDIELTSSRDDGTWTWRAAGAKKPKGVLDGSLIPDGVGIGDVVKVEAEAYMEGLEITTVFAPKAARKQAETLELLGSGRDEPLVTQVLAPKGKGRGRGRDGDRGRGRGRDGERGRGRDGERGRGRDGRDGDRKGRGGRDNRGERSDRRERPKAPARPKAPRLRPGRVHRQAALKALPDLQHKLADEVLRGGVPGVRQAVDRMNEKAAAEGMPKIKTEPLVALAEKLAPSLKAAEWRDRAEAALAGITEIDVKDIRSVVVAADSGARDDESRALADQLRDGLTARVDAEHRKWLDELAENIAQGRTVRALRDSSRPPKAGAPLPPDMAERLAAAASASLTSEVTQDRWATVLDAVAFSPVKGQVVPEGQPANPNDQLLAAVRKHASKVPAIASSFGVEAPAARKRGGRRTPPPPPKAQVPPPPAAEAAPTPSPTETPPEAPTEPVVPTDSVAAEDAATEVAE